MRITDIFLAFPILVSLLVLRNVLAEVPYVDTVMGDKTSIRFMVILLSAVGWMAVARIVRGEVLSLKQREFVEAARSLGASGPRIMFKHLIPNSLGPIMVALSLSVVDRHPRRVDAVVLRLRAEPGRGAHDVGSPDRPVEADDPVRLLVAGACSRASSSSSRSCAINFVGDGLRDSFDPKAKQERRERRPQRRRPDPRADRRSEATTTSPTDRSFSRSATCTSRSRPSPATCKPCAVST